MGKYLVILLVFVVLLQVCLSGPHWRRGRDRRERRQRRMRDRSGWDFPMSHRGMSSMFGRGRHSGRHSFGFGPREDPWFGLDFSWGAPSREEPWWTGPNVCFSRTESLDNDTAEITPHSSFQSVICDGSETAFKCAKTELTPRGKETTTDVYECCTGFTRTSGDFGCIKEVVLKDIPHVLEALELTEMIKLFENSGLSQKILTKDSNNFTIFAPTNDAIKSYLPLVSTKDTGVDLKDFGSVVMVSQEISDAVLDSTRNILLGHVAAGRVTSPQMSDNTIIETASPLKTTIRINMYQRPVSLLTANCQKITSVDNMASNGVVHVVDGVLKPVSETLFDLIKKNPELGTLKTALGSSPLASSLREDGQYTLFAPTDAAFKKHNDLMMKIMGKQDCLDNVLKNHLVPHVVCSSVIKGETHTDNALNRQTHLRRSADDKLYVDGAQIVASDVMATNGVLYIIDDVLIPDEALNVIQLAEKNNHSEFVKLVELAGMKKEIKLLDNATVFIPSNEAIKALPAEIVADKKAVQDMLQYHVVSDIWPSKKFYNDLQLDTLQGTQLRVNEYSSFPFGRHWTQTVHCAKLQTEHIKGCNTAVYVIDKVLAPPSGNVIDVLSQDKRLSTLMDLVKMAGLADTLQETGPYTIFAPTNEAFDALGSDAVNEMKQNPEILKSILLNHVSKDSICCAGVMHANWFDSQRVRALSGKMFHIGKTRTDGAYIGNSNVIQCDQMATNGVVHVIDDVITSRRRRTAWDWIWEF